MEEVKEEQAEEVNRSREVSPTETEANREHRTKWSHSSSCCQTVTTTTEGNRSESVK